MKVISVIQQKGGVGKTTLTVHLAHELKARFPKLAIAIADADPQGSASKWITRGAGNNASNIKAYAVAGDRDGKKLQKELEHINADFVIVDLPPAIEAVSLRAALYSNLMLVPVGASALDLEAAKAAIDVCKEALSLDKNKKFLIVPTRVQGTTAAGKEVRDVLSKWGPVSKATMSLRVAYADAATVGEGINTYAPGSAAHKEVKALADEAIKLLGGK